MKLDRVSQALVPLLLLTVWSLALVLGRIVVFGGTYYYFLLWNVLLAWVPVIISSYLFWGMIHKQLRAKKVILGILLVIWLLFLPNAPYLLTDFVHLEQRGNVPLSYDVLLLLSFSILGLFQFEYSLIQIRDVLRKVLHVSLTRWFVPAVIILNSIGLYVGRFLRWNSWEIATDPLKLVSDSWRIVTAPQAMVLGVGYIVISAGLLALFHYLVHSVRDLLSHD
jgi:uncharacterized membrane protein